MPAIGRFLIVVTFLEDALRILTQWNDQLLFLRDYRHSTFYSPSSAFEKKLTNNTVPWGITHLFLIFNVVAMLISSTLVIARKHSDFAVGGLLGVVVTQAIGYGLIFDLNFFLRNLSVIGGLLLVVSDSWVRKKYMPAGLPQLDENDRKMYVQLAGRVLLILLFIGFVFAGQWSFWRVLVSVVGFVACVMVVVGFKAKMSAVILVVLLSIFNVLVNNFWTVCPLFINVFCLPSLTVSAQTPPPQQGLCQVRLFPGSVYCVCFTLNFSSNSTNKSSGGLLLLVNMGPGQFSVDEKKKVY